VCENLLADTGRASNLTAAAFQKWRRGGPPMDRLDEEKLEMLRTWGEGLLNDGRDELRAAGRAIMMLVEEIERLHVDLWHARQDTPEEAVIQRAEPGEPRRKLSLAVQRRISALRRGLSGSADE
jgi:hypothetical protein